MSPSHLTKRGGVWTYKRRVPNEFWAYDPRGFVYQSTRIRVSEDRGAVKAGRMAEHINKDTEAFWRGLVTGRAGEAQTQ